MARAVIAAGARLVALDGAPRDRPGGEALRDVVAAIHEPGGAALADVGTVDDARYAVSCGVDSVGTTLSGYDADSLRQEGPDFALREALARELPVAVFAEGRIWTREEARRALDLGAAFVVVGTAITNPTAITVRFVAAVDSLGRVCQPRPVHFVWLSFWPSRASRRCCGRGGRRPGPALDPYDAHDEGKTRLANMPGYFPTTFGRED